MSRLRIPFVAFLGGAAVLGCQPSLDGMRFRCGSDLDCPPGWVCDPAARQCVHPEAFGDPGGEIRTDPGLDPGVELGLDTGLDRPEGPPDPSGTDPSSDEPGRELPEDTAPDRGEDSQTDTADVPDVPDAGDVPPPPCDPDPTCDDGNPCTDDLRCPAPLGCIHKYNQAPCAEARCEAGQFFPESVCAAATCSAQVPVSCDDGDACTSDSCDPSAGCRHSAGALDCDDHDACTEDGCDPVKGCTHVPGALDCDDSNDCTADT